MISDRFSREAFENSDRAAQNDLVNQLQLALAEELCHITDYQEFFAEIRRLTAALRELGHDLWNWEYDGSGGELWGGDYTKPEACGRLKIAFHFPGTVTVVWGDWEQSST